MSDQQGPADYTVDEEIVVGGRHGKNLDALARSLVYDTPKHRRQNHLRYVLEQALRILDTDVSGQGIE